MQEDNIKLYEQKEHWGELKLKKIFLRKVRLIKALIPEDVETILDSGCGDGALTNLLSDKYKVIGLDRSEEALKHVITGKIKGNVDRMPFPDASFDLVISSQVLEHLPSDIYKKAIKELSRVSKKYLIVGVPFRERLAQNTTKCFKCGQKYHLWGHLRRFKSIKQVDSLFPEFKPREHIFTNKNSWKNAFVLWAKQAIGNEWPWEKKVICPKCGFKNPEKNKNMNSAVKYITDRILWRMQEKEEYWWSITLFEKKQK